MKNLRYLINEMVLLLEYDRYTTIKQHGEKALSVALKRDEHDSYLRDIQNLNDGVVRGHPDLRDKPPREAAMHELMGQFEEVDPTHNKKYVQHIARIYGNSGVNRHEDIYSRMKPALHDFDELSRRKILPAEHRDIGRIKSLSQLEDLIEPYKDQTSKRQGDKSNHEKMKSESTITDYPTFTHIVPHTAAAASHFGKGTRWCTATENPEDSAFDSYNGYGSLHILTPKNPKYKNEKYQAHLADERNGMKLAETPEDATLMDDHDDPGHKQLRTNHPEIYDHLNYLVNEANRQSTTVGGYAHPDPAVQLETLRNYPAGTKREHIEHLLDSKNPDIVLATANTGKAGKYDERIYNAATKVLDGPKGDQGGPFGHDPGIAAERLMNSKNVHSNTLEAIIDHPRARGLNVKYEAASHPNLNKEAIEEYSDHPNEKVRQGIAGNPSTPDEHIKLLMKDEDRLVRNEAHKTWRDRTYAASPRKRLSDIIFHGKKDQ